MFSSHAFIPCASSSFIADIAVLRKVERTGKRWSLTPYACADKGDTTSPSTVYDGHTESDERTSPHATQTREHPVQPWIVSSYAIYAVFAHNTIAMDTCVSFNRSPCILVRFHLRIASHNVHHTINDTSLCSPNPENDCLVGLLPVNPS